MPLSVGGQVLRSEQLPVPESASAKAAGFEPLRRYACDTVCTKLADKQFARVQQQYIERPVKSFQPAVNRLLSDSVGVHQEYLMGRKRGYIEVPVVPGPDHCRPMKNRGVALNTRNLRHCHQSTRGKLLSS